MLTAFICLGFSTNLSAATAIKWTCPPASEVQVVSGSESGFGCQGSCDNTYTGYLSGSNGEQRLMTGFLSAPKEIAPTGPRDNAATFTNGAMGCWYEPRDKRGIGPSLYTKNNIFKNNCTMQNGNFQGVSDGVTCLKGSFADCRLVCGTGTD